MARSGVATQIYLTPGQRQALEELARANRTTISAEVSHAVDRHLASPPARVTPPLADVRVPAPRKKLGRPRKAAG